jgi:hypothetical protein
MGTALKRGFNEKEPVAMEFVFGALIAYADDEDAKGFLEEHGYDVSVAKIRVFRNRVQNPTDMQYPAFQKRRAQLAPMLEAEVADDMLSNARRITKVESHCIQQLEEQAKLGEIKDVSRVMRDISQVRTQSIDKRLALQGRPTQITEHRNTDEILAKLESMGVAQKVEAESTAVEESDTPSSAPGAV